MPAFFIIFIAYTRIPTNAHTHTHISTNTSSFARYILVFAVLNVPKHLAYEWINKMNVNELFMHAYEKQKHLVKVKLNRQKVHIQHLEKEKDREGHTRHCTNKKKHRKYRCLSMRMLAYKVACENGADAFIHVIVLRVTVWFSVGHQFYQRSFYFFFSRFQTRAGYCCYFCSCFAKYCMFIKWTWRFRAWK